jgi:exopolyphosphatase/guanosine-5'-triphosphate,3'-diphosphate pyrophosphatase
MLMRYLTGGGAFAALDLGTTNCRLLVARPAGSTGFRVVDSFSRIVRLGEGIETSGRLGEAAMERTLRALEVCAGKLQQWRLSGFRAVATEACRRAENCGEFVERVRERTGIQLEIISSAEEARLVLCGCLPLLDAARRSALVFDIGGGSTEILWVALEGGRAGLSPTIRGVVSLPHGVVSLTERFGRAGSDGETFARMVAEVSRPLMEFDTGHGIAEAVGAGTAQMLGSSGTVTTLAAIELGLTRYDRARVDGVSLDVQAVHRISQDLVRIGAAGRASHPCIGPGRADLMVAGCAILTAICRTWPAGRLRVADRGVREGILADLIAGRRHAPAPGLAEPALVPHGA